MRKTVLIVDDVEMNREILSEMLEEEYDILTAADGVEALEVITENRSFLTVILLDLMMPKLDGFDVLKALNKAGVTIPVLVITGDDTVETEAKCFDYGVVDFIAKPFNNAIVQRRVSSAAELYLYRNRLEETVDRQTEQLRKQNAQLAEQAAKLKESYINVIAALGTMVEARNNESGEHIRRVKDYTKIIAEAMLRLHPDCGLDEHSIEVITTASPLHDIGKIMISDSVLLKPGRFTDEEREIMQRHTILGCELIGKTENVLDEEYSRVSADIARYHHERWDGRGYPDGLTGDDIPLSAQIVALADVYDALVNERVYKKAIPLSKAYDMIVSGVCGEFSPLILECFKAAREEMEKNVSNPAPEE